MDGVRWTQGAKGRKSDNMADYNDGYFRSMDNNTTAAGACDVFVACIDRGFRQL